MVYAAVGGRIGAEPAIRFSGRKGVDTNTSTLALQDARLPCGKRMAYAAVRRDLNTESAISFLGRKDSIQKRVPRLCRMPDCHAISAWPMLRSEGVWTLDLQLDSLVGRVGIQKRAHRLCRMPDCYATSAWPMLWSEGVWTLSQRLDSPSRKDSIQKRAP